MPTVAPATASGHHGVDDGARHGDAADNLPRGIRVRNERRSSIDGFISRQPPGSLTKLCCVSLGRNLAIPRPKTWAGGQTHPPTLTDADKPPRVDEFVLRPDPSNVARIRSLATAQRPKPSPRRTARPPMAKRPGVPDRLDARGRSRWWKRPMSYRSTRTFPGRR